MAPMAATRTLLPRANAAACPQLAKADFASSSRRVQRTAALNDMLVETTPEPLADGACSALGRRGEHGKVRIRRKETCGRRTRGQDLIQSGPNTCCRNF